MTTYLYEKDLVPQKYRILVADRHDVLVRKLALELDIPVQELRRFLIEHLDMMLLENLPARAEMADAYADQDDPVSRALGREKFSQYLQIIPPATMESIFQVVCDQVHTGIPMETALAYSMEKMREELRR